MSFIKENFHPNAYLQNIRNVKSGLLARTRVLQIVENKLSTASQISKGVLLPYTVVIHHLRLLENEGIVSRNGRRPYYWKLTGIGQRRLES